jgi:hypothetical protein
VAKARDVQLGNPKQAKANKREADRCAKALRPILNELSLRPSHLSIHGAFAFGGNPAGNCVS